MDSIENLSSVDEVIDFLIHSASQEVIDNACHDALLVLHFFPQLGPEFKTSPDIYEENIEEFKHSFDYEQLGLDRETTLQKIAKYRSIDRVLDVLVKMTPAKTKEELIRRYLLEVWFKQNSNGDLKHFKNSLKKDYWFKM